MAPGTSCELSNSHFCCYYASLPLLMENQKKKKNPQVFKSERLDLNPSSAIYDLCETKGSKFSEPQFLICKME